MAKAKKSLPLLLFVGRPHYASEELNVHETEADLIDSCQAEPGDVVLVGTYELVGTEKRQLAVRSQP